MKTDESSTRGPLGWSGRAADTQPLQPRNAHFDRAQNAWVLSRYADVLAALREPRLCQVGPRAESGSGFCDKRKQSQKRAEARATLTHSKLAEWRGRIELLTHSMIGQLPEDRSIDLVHEFIWPWSLAVTLIINGLDAIHSHRLADLAYYLPGGEADCHNAVLRSRAAAALAELRWSLPKRVGVTQICKLAFRVLFRLVHCSIATVSFALPKRVANAQFEKRDRKRAIPLGKSVFLGTSQTIPLFLANAWLALLRHPAELARLRAEPDLIPRAIEELLRYAGVVHTLYRQATANVDLAGVRILENERVILKVASANRDPAQFPEPDRLDVTRRVTGQVALGAGPHSCVGASLVRMAAGIATSGFVAELAVAETGGPVEWYRNRTVCSPASVPVRLQRLRPNGKS